MASDTKKVQTLINRAAQAAIDISQSANDLEALEALYDAQSVNAIDTPLQGKYGQLTAWIAIIRSTANNPITVEMIAANVPTHNGNGFK